MENYWQQYHRMVWHMRYSLINNTNVPVSIAETAHTKLKAGLREFAADSGINIASEGYWQTYLKYIVGSPAEDPNEPIGAI